jgi:hypothetical protein
MAWAAHYDVGHRIFNREPVTLIWSNRLKVFGIGRRQLLDLNEFQLLNVTSFRGTQYRVDCRFRGEETVGYWVELQDLTQRRYAVLLPTDGGRSANYRLNLEFSPNGSQILWLTATLAVPPDDGLAWATHLWDVYRTGDLMSAERVYRSRGLKAVLKAENRSPLAAIVACLVLLRVDNRTELRNGLPEMIEQFSALSDPPVLFAELLAREGQLDDACRYLLLSMQRGMPLTSEAISYAAALADRLSGAARQLSADQQQELKRLRDRLGQGLRHITSGDLFVSIRDWHFEEAIAVFSSSRLG